jgi:hypothetical protein
MPDLWENLVPEAKKSIEKNGNKGKEFCNRGCGLSAAI